MEENKTRKPVKLGTLRKMHQEGEPIVMLTCYDASFAALEDEAGVDIMLIGDSLGMTIQGHGTTIPVSIDDMAYHTACVARGNKNAFVLADMNFGSYLVNEDEAVRNAVKLMKAGANMVKFEGGLEVCPLVRRLKQIGIPVCAHIGFTPQSVNAIGGYYVQGKTANGEEKLYQEAMALQEAGADMVLFEMVPAGIASKITKELSIPTIGIGARCRHIGSGACAPGYSRHLPRPQAEVLEEFYGRRFFHSAGCSQLCSGGEKQTVPD